MSDFFKFVLKKWDIGMWNGVISLRIGNNFQLLLKGH